ncbi:AmmeMemoRadiSam system protein A [Melioribacteraceae bacterium 4301-Me]|uniref:AmmeMemoRadiSam system protein A n=1 Tax=Pyranulibacter aquaticus TaxID=3163344 RepID=UPI0035958036
MELSKEEKTVLLKAARQSIESLFTDKEFPTTDYKKYPKFKQKAGAFVTLTEHGNLRGCIGYIVSNDTLFNTVCNAAIQAAESDPRFPPVEEHELKDILIEISILSPAFPMKSYDEIQLGKHGLILEEKGRRGLLLPQVPIEYNMNKEQYLDAICQKAGFPAGYWRDKKLNISLFTATVFNEKEIVEV